VVAFYLVSIKLYALTYFILVWIDRHVACFTLGDFVMTILIVGWFLLVSVGSLSRVFVLSPWVSFLTFLCTFI